MDATLNSLKVLDNDGRPNSIAMSFGRMLLTDECPDVILGYLDECLGFDFSVLKPAQNILQAHI
jgi:hypothetical protein